MGAQFTEGGRGDWLLCRQECKNREGLAASRRVRYNSEFAVNKLLLAIRICSLKQGALMLLHGVQKAILMWEKLRSNQGILKGFRVR